MKKKFILASLVAAGLVATASQTKMFVYNNDGTKYEVDVAKVDSVTFVEVPDVPEENLEDCTTVKAEESELMFVFDDEAMTASVTGFDKSKIGKDLVIPCFVENEGKEYKVTSIKKAALQQAPVVNMIIGNTVSSIGSYAFSYMDDLEKVVFPKNLEVLSEFLFLQTNKLYDITLPEKLKVIKKGALEVVNVYGKTEKLVLPSTVEKIEDDAFGSTSYVEIVIPKGCILEGYPFYGCRSLEKVVVDQTDPNYSNYDGCLYNKEQTVLIYCPGGKTTVKFPSTVTEAAKNAFATSIIKSIELPNTFTKLGDFVFESCYELESAILPESITELPMGAFYTCFRLKNITLPSKLKVIGDKAFLSIDSLETITIPNTVEKIGNMAFNSCEKLDSVIVPNTVTSFGTEMFSECPSLRYVALPEGLDTIPKRTFFACKKLEKVVMPKNVTTIDPWAFQTCMSLKKIDIPNTVTTIGDNAFGSCADTVIIIPNSVTSIGKNAFNGCDNATRIEIPSSITTLPYRVFAGCRALESVVIPASVTSIDGTAFAGCKVLKSIEVEEGNTKYKSVGGIVYNSDLTTIVLCPPAIESVVIPETVTTIGDNLFSGFTNLKTISIPSSVTTIGANAFDESKIETLVIPATVKSVGDEAFLYAKIDTLTFEGDTELGENVFSRAAINNLTLPSSVTEITESFFEDVNVENIVFPASVTVIPDGAFSRCWSVKKITVSKDCVVSEKAFMMPDRVEIVRY